ncbi:MAG TPA: chromosome segregation protein SMC [Spirochaeta sp.]|nr:chromosome segregation protein SMC [Spirochaeta sp.]
MFLKSVEIFGFKSFADRTVIEFSEGISALLGPNGCGKSNVVDAIKWVLGEQSSKTLRAEKMEDVIFNGTENRKALNVAEVTLLISNDAGILELDIPEISVRRRLYRSGESEYLINNTLVKLKELRELFFDTGIGKTAYSIMEQGKIDQILSNKPEERRYLFEEAAGITKYKMRGAEAERKLARTEENMRQVESILSEVKRSHDSLKVQADKTIKYRELKNLVFDAELDLQLLKLRGIMESSNGADDKLKTKVADKQKLTDEIDNINESLEENLDLVNNMESDLIESQKKLYGIDLEKTGKESQERMLAERRIEITKQAESCIAREENLKNRIESINIQIKERNSELEESGKRVRETETNIAGFEKSINTAADRISENEKSITEAERRADEGEKTQIDLQEELRRITDDIVSQLDTRLKETGYSLNERKAAEQHFNELIERLRIHLDGKKKFFDDARKTSAFSEKPGKLLDAAEESVADGASRIDELRQAFKDYRETIPAFIDEFLAPEGIIVKKRDLDTRLEQNRNMILSMREKARDLREENRKLNKKIDEYRKTLEDLKMTKVRMETRLNAVRDAVKQNERELNEQQGLLVENRNDLESCNSRLGNIGEQLKQIEVEKAELQKREQKLRKELDRLENGISKRNVDMKSREKRLKSKMENLGKIQQQIETLHIEISNFKVEIRNVYDNFRDRHSRDLSDYDSKMYELPGEIREYRERLAKKKDELKSLGSVNLMAPEEYEEVKERYDFLNNQINDLNQAREDLKQITDQIRTESTELFVETYNNIRKNFHIMFRRMFGGGRAELKLNEPEHVLTSGIEIYAQPPGKKLENIALLSGGERSLTAVAMLFATYMVKPSPFCILDEIDAALDEANVGRFVNTLVEFGKKSQFIVITHNKKTVTGAGALLGVTMEESGVSKAVAIRLDNTGVQADEQEEAGVI